MYTKCLHLKHHQIPNVVMYKRRNEISQHTLTQSPKNQQLNNRFFELNYSTMLVHCHHPLTGIATPNSNLREVLLPIETISKTLQKEQKGVPTKHLSLQNVQGDGLWIFLQSQKRSTNLLKRSPFFRLDLKLELFPNCLLRKNK